ncbi:MAG: hypothetical protein ABSF82_11480 [Candidatus Bathyarchaeia archaeon]
MDKAAFYACNDCSYEFLTNAKEPSCPRCKSKKLSNMDMKKLSGLDE